MTGSYSLLELNLLLKGSLRAAFPTAVWVRAEVSELKMSQPGHCYLEFVEKDSRGSSVVARMRGMVWASVYRPLKERFEQATGQRLVAGVKVLAAVKVVFHEQYGLALEVQAIDPTFTLGEMALQRRMVLLRLERDGVLGLNKELSMSEAPQRVAVVSSPNAAGYEDFVNQLAHNRWKIRFYFRLFPAVMQGERCEESVIDALDRIYRQADAFDVVVLIRGGGASADLGSFDRYELASHCAQFPIPIITGIGHERDDTVADMVAHTRVKTPTAAAEFLIGRCAEVMQRMDRLAGEIPQSIARRMVGERQRMDRLEQQIAQATARRMADERQRIGSLRESIRRETNRRLVGERQRMDHLAEMIEAVSPFNILKRGFTISYSDGKRVVSSGQLSVGEELTILFADGEAISRIEQIEVRLPKIDK